MSIQVGDTLPSVTFKVMGEKGPESVTTLSLFAGKKVVLFAVPGAFTPGCTLTHLPGFVVNADKIKAKGVDSIVCTAVNDAFVMDAWGKSQNADEIIMAADGSAEFAKAIGLELDLTEGGLGIRSKRYAMIVNDCKVELLNIDTKGVDQSSAETILAAL
ncbi:peroxiredoxin [Marinobacterium zhoushanense]|uniref:Glutathione-dependent peroxiredoxin n=1 Tax=Marinobacterium zhoushanense TaxID=1679163 RepID=A0ABQ1KFY0_9GAMM|nr:peroxiredoxin [Marinobacterium zhoushanense]GGB97989.1 peroxiredoxin [Marinobacterium zhoushanense]